MIKIMNDPYFGWCIGQGQSSSLSSDALRISEGGMSDKFRQTFRSSLKEMLSVFSETTHPGQSSCKNNNTGCSEFSLSRQGKALEMSITLVDVLMCYSLIDGKRLLDIIETAFWEIYRGDSFSPAITRMQNCFLAWCLPPFLEALPP